MKMTIDIPNAELEEALHHTGARTGQEAVVAALAKFNRGRRLGRLVERFGSHDHFLTLEELRSHREEG